MVLSCEHAGREVPARWAPLFRGAGDVLDSHRGWDPGARTLARGMARALGVPLLEHATTRLLVDVNRSRGHPRLFSELTRALPAEEKDRILGEAWGPHRAAVERAVREAGARGGPAVHVGVHTFTPVLDGRPRAVEVGVLYDPAREGEVELARRWLRELRHRLPGFRVRANAPYRGVADGLVTHLRRVLGPEAYLGLELEVGQGLRDRRGRFAPGLAGELAAALRAALDGDR